MRRVIAILTRNLLNISSCVHYILFSLRLYPTARKLLKYDHNWTQTHRARCEFAKRRTGARAASDVNFDLDLDSGRYNTIYNVLE